MGALAVKTVVSWTDETGNDHDGPLVTRAKDHDIVACRMCGFRHVVPLPQAAALEHAYREAYYTEEKPTFLEHAGEDQEWAALFQRDRLESFERLLPAHTRHLLDVGCGPGFFLKPPRIGGWRGAGNRTLTSSRRARPGAGAGSGRRLFQCRDSTASGTLRRRAFEQCAGARAQPDGSGGAGPRSFEPRRAFVPRRAQRFHAASGKRAGRRESLPEWWVAPPHHLNYFDFATLGHLVSRFGFEVRERSTSFPMELFLQMGLDYTKDPELGLACHNQRKRFDLGLEAAGFKETRRAFYRALAEAGLGREAAIIAVKK